MANAGIVEKKLTSDFDVKMGINIESAKTGGRSRCGATQSLVGASDSQEKRAGLKLARCQFRSRAPVRMPLRPQHVLPYYSTGGK